MLLKPGRQQKVKPSGFISIDRGHPLAANLAVALFFNEHGATAFNLVHPGKNATLLGTAFRDEGIYGTAINLPSADNAAVVQTSSIGLTTNRCSFVVSIKPSGTQVASAGIIVDGQGASPIGMTYASDGVDLGYRWNSGAINFDSGIAIPANQDSFVALTISPTQAVAYVNGSKATNTATHNTQALTTLDIGLDRTVSTRHFAGLVHYAYLYNQTLPDNLIYWLKEEPFAFVETDLERQYFVFPDTYIVPSGLFATISANASISADLSAGSADVFLAATIAASSTIVADVTRSVTLNASIPVVSTISAALANINQNLAGTIAGSSAVSANLTRIIGLNASIPAVSTISAVLADIPRNLAVSINASSTITADATRSVTLNASISGTSTVSAALTDIPRNLAVNINSASTITAEAQVQLRLASTIAATSTLSGAIGAVTQNLATNIDATSTISAVLDGIPRILAVGITSNASISAVLADIPRNLAVSINASSTITADATRSVTLNASISGTSTVSAALADIARNLAVLIASNASVSASLGASPQTLSVNISVTSAIVADVQQSISLNASASVNSAISAALQVSRDLSSGIVIASVVAATTQVSKPLQVDIDATSSMSGGFNATLFLQAILVFQSSIVATLKVVHTELDHGIPVCSAQFVEKAYISAFYVSRPTCTATLIDDNT